MEREVACCCLRSGDGAGCLIAWVRWERFMCRQRLHEETCCLRARVASRGIVVVKVFILAGLTVCMVEQSEMDVEVSEFNASSPSKSPQSEMSNVMRRRAATPRELQTTPTSKTAFTTNACKDSTHNAS